MLSSVPFIRRHFGAAPSFDAGTLLPRIELGLNTDQSQLFISVRPLNKTWISMTVSIMEPHFRDTIPGLFSLIRLRHGDVLLMTSLIKLHGLQCPA